MDRGMAAYYCGLSPGTFDERIKSGQFPKPHRDGRRLLWDIRELDRAMGDIDAEAETGAESRDVLDAEARALAAISR